MSTSLRRRAYQAICGKIIRGSLPPGSRISDFTIAKELGISRSPVREAISQLASEGLVVSIPEVGAFARKFTRADIEHLYQFRCWLEAKAIEEAMHRVTAEDLEQLRGYCRDILTIARELRDSGAPHLSLSGHWRWLKADFAFHFTMVRAAGNPLVLKTVASQYFLCNYLNGHVWQHTLSDVVRLCRYHRAILRALRHKNVAVAQQLIIEHAERGRRHAVERLEHQGGRHGTTGSNEGGDWLSALQELVEGIVQEGPSPSPENPTLGADDLDLLSR
jgi:DNA-binding GntR family transcriptional regulator